MVATTASCCSADRVGIAPVDDLMVLSHYSNAYIKEGKNSPQHVTMNMIR
jgi:hypothetical protein